MTSYIIVKWFVNFSFKIAGDSFSWSGWKDLRETQEKPNNCNAIRQQLKQGLSVCWRYCHGFWESWGGSLILIAVSRSHHDKSDRNKSFCNETWWMTWCPGCLDIRESQLLIQFTWEVMRGSQLRFERHPCVHKMFLNMWGEPLVFSYQAKPPATLLCTNLLNPHMFLYLLTKVSQIWVVGNRFSQKGERNTSWQVKIFW